MKSFGKLLWILGVLVVVVAGVAFWARPVSFFNGITEARLYLRGVRSNSVMVAGHRMHYYVDGPIDGRVIVLVHGLGGRSEDWSSLEPYLAGEGFRVYMPDLPGYGNSEQPADFSYSVPDEAAAVVGFLDALGLKQVDLGGWSMGGWIAQLVALGHPERVGRLMLFDSAGLYEKPAWDTRLFTPQTPEELDQLDALLMPKPPKVPGFIAQDILRHSKQNAWVVQRALATMLTGKDATDGQLPKLRMPVLIVWGELDQITPLSQGRRLNQLIPQSQLVVFPNCGHLAPNQCAGDIGPELIEFER
jgi:pimeloyl-ACP methyl ester carboxylesterase